MNTLRIDDKWAIKYDPINNDNPMQVTRYGENAGDCKEWNNLQTAMFYALLEARLPSQAETLAWAVIGPDGEIPLVYTGAGAREIERARNEAFAAGQEEMRERAAASLDAGLFASNSCYWITQSAIRALPLREPGAA